MTETDVTWLTQEAYDRLVAELADREGPTREQIKNRIAAAREEGDLKENGGYHAAREEQGKNEGRIRQLEATAGKVVTVYFAAWDEEETFLLGSREEAAHASIEVYSPTSPLGAAVNGAKVGDTVTYTLANGNEMNVAIRKVAPYGG